MTVLLWVLVHMGDMGGFSLHSDRLSPISLWFYNGDQEGDGSILLIGLHCKLDGWFNTVNVLMGVLFMDFLVHDTYVIHIPAPEPGGGGSTESFLLKVLHI